MFLIEMLVYFMQTIISYSLMQAIMSENFWIFTSIVLGYVLGYFLFYNDLSVNLDKVANTTYTAEQTGGIIYWMDATYSGSRVSFMGLNGSTVSLLASLKPGDKVTFTSGNLGMGTPTKTTLTVVNFVNQGGGNHYLYVVEPNNVMSFGFNTVYGITVESHTLSNYQFAADGTFVADAVSTTNLVADSALIGNVGIVDNTIYATNAYGQPSTLVIEGDTDINVIKVETKQHSSVDTNASSIEWRSPTMYPMNALWFGSSPTTYTQNLLSSLNSGDSFTVYDMYSMQSKTFTVAGSGYYDSNGWNSWVLPISNVYSVSEGHMFSDQQGITTVMNVSKKHSFTGNGLTVSGDLTVTGNVISSTPSSSITATRGDLGSLITFSGIDSANTYAQPLINASYIKVGNIVRVTIDVVYDPGTILNQGYFSPQIILPFSKAPSTTASVKVLNLTINGDAGVKYGTTDLAGGLGVQIDYTWQMDAMAPPSPPRYTWMAIGPMDSWAYLGKRHIIEVEYETI